MGKSNNPTHCAPASTAWSNAAAAAAVGVDQVAAAGAVAARVALLAVAFGPVGQAIPRGLLADSRYGATLFPSAAPRQILLSVQMQGRA